MRGPTHWAYLAGPVTVALNALLLWPVLGATTSTGNVARLVTLLAVAGLAAPVLSLGTHMFVLKRAGSEAEQRGQATTLLVGLALLGLVGAVASWWTPHGHYLYAGCASAAFLVAQASLRAQLRPLRFVVATVGCATAAVGVAGIGGEAAGLAGASAGYAVTIWFCILLTSASRDPVWRSTGPRRVARAVAFGLPLVPGLVLYLMIPQGSRILVGATGSELDLLVFQYASLVTLGSVTLVTSVSAHFGAASMGADTAETSSALLRQMRLAVGCVVAVVLVAVPVFVLVAGPVWLPSSVPLGTWRWVVVALLPVVPLQALSDLVEYEVLVGGSTRALVVPAVVGALTGGVTFTAATMISESYWAGVVAVDSAVCGRLLALAITSRARAENLA